MAPRILNTIPVAPPDEPWDTRITPVADGSSQAPAAEERARLHRTRAGPSPDAPSSQLPSATTKAEAVVSQDGDDAVIRLRIPRTLPTAQDRTAATPGPSRLRPGLQIEGHPSLTDTQRAPSPTDPAKRFYGVVPNLPSPRATTASRGLRQMEVSTVSSTLPVATVAGETIRDGAPQPQIHDRLPDFPAWLAAFMLGLLALGIATAVVFYLVNFPPALSWLGGDGRSSYRRVRQGDDVERDEREGTDLPLREYPAFSTSAEVPAAPLRERRSALDLSLDTAATAGLGITGAGQDPAGPGKRASLDSRLSARDLRPLQRAATASRRPTTAPLPCTLRFESPLVGPDSPRFRFRPPRRVREPDLEDGLLEPHRSGSGSGSDNLPPSPASSDSDSRSSSGLNLLERIGDRVESAAGYVARKLHDHVHDGDAEEGLVLPVRRAERERGELKKEC